MLNLFKFHLFLPDPKKTTSFLIWWSNVKDAIFKKGLTFYLMQANGQTQTKLVTKIPS